MAEAPRNPCGGITSSGNCGCGDYVKAAGRQGIWEVCANCTHTAQAHGVKPSAQTYTVTDAPKPVRVPHPIVVTAEGPAKSIADASATLPPAAEIRAWLRNNGFTPGARGRIHPDHLKAYRQAMSSK